MAWVGLVLGGFGFILSHRYRHKIDAQGINELGRLKGLLQRLLHPQPPADEDLELVERLASGVKAGLSLDAALEETASRAGGSITARQRAQAVLHGQTQTDFLSRFLHSALESGAPCLLALESFARAFRTRRRLRLKAVGMTSQCRAQAEALAWLPWALAVVMGVVDPGGVKLAAGHAGSWLCWALALALSGSGRRWIRSWLDSALRPQSEAERFEEEGLPELVLGIIGGLSCGLDPESAMDRAAGSFPPAVRQAITGTGLASLWLRRLVEIVRHASRTGAPLRDELALFLQDLEAETEARWESRVQRLPVVLLAPLFVCFFPGSILVVAGFLLPLLGSAL